MKYIITTILLSIHSFFLIAQTATETIFLTTKEECVFIFEKEPDFANVSTKKVKHVIDGNRILLVPLEPFDDARLITQIESKVYEIKLDWSSDKSKITFYKDYRESSVNDCISPPTAKELAEKRYVEGNKFIVTKEVLSTVSAKLTAFRNHKITGTKLFDNRAFSDGFQANLVVGFVDDNHFYFKFRLKNKQSIIYDLNPIRLSYESRQKKNLFKEDAIYKVEVKPTVLSSDITSIAANSTEFYFMAIPLFALNSNGKLKITFSERNGMRDVTVPIFSNRISNLKYVGNDYDLINLSNSTSKN